LYVKLQFTSNYLKKFETKERTAVIARNWRELSDGEKTSYKDKVTQVTFIKTMFGEKC
jgi:hypothetical protein